MDVVALAVYLWLLAFGAPHVWWLLGFPAAFPGGEESLARALSSPLFVAYDLGVVLLCGVAFWIVLLLTRQESRPGLIQRLARIAAWVASILLTGRGIAGVAADGLSDLFWWPMFLVGGILFGILAGRARATGGFES